MEEIINVSGRQYKISAEDVSPQKWLEIKADTIRQLEVGCGKTLSPATGCGVTKYVGQSVTLTATASGTAPYTYTWTITDPDNIVTNPTANPYVLNLTKTGTYKTYLTVTDSCPTGALTCRDPATGTCDIIVTVCPAPSCSYTVT